VGIALHTDSRRAAIKPYTSCKLLCLAPTKRGV
jgi:hypothetical protein